MSTESQIAPEPAQGLAGAATFIAPETRWRLPISYGSIASTALCIDLALILGSAMLAKAIYNNIPDAFTGEYSHTFAAAGFVAVLFVAVMRVQRLYSPTRLMVWDDQARAVLGAWCGAFLILASGVFSWGVSHDLSRGDVLLFWAVGVVALLGHRAAWRIVLPQALESGALRGRTIVSLTCEESVPPEFTDNLIRHGYHAASHFYIPEGGSRADEVIDNVISLCRTSNIEEVMLFIDPEHMSNVRQAGETAAGAAAACHAGSIRDAGATVPARALRYWRYGCDRASTRGVVAGEQAVKRAIDIVFSFVGLIILSPILLAAAIAIRLDSPGPALFRQTRHGFNGRPFRIYKFRTMTVMENGDVVPQAQKERQAGDAGRPVAAPVQHRRTAAIDQRVPWRHVAGGAASARVGARTLFHFRHREIRFPPPHEVRHNRLGAGSRRPRRDRYARQDGATGRARYLVH